MSHTETVARFAQLFTDNQDLGAEINMLVRTELGLEPDTDVDDNAEYWAMYTKLMVEFINSVATYVDSK